MEFAFKVLHNDDGTIGEEFIKLGARLKDGFKLGTGDVLHAENVITHDKYHLKTDEEISQFAIDHQLIWNPLEEHKELNQSAIRRNVSPSHYKNYFQKYQWFEVMQEIVPDIDSVSLAMVYKYLARSGKKDNKTQEALKALWYLKFYTARLIAGRNIEIAEVDNILNSIK